MAGAGRDGGQEHGGSPARRLDRWDGQAVEELQASWEIPLLEAYEAIGSTSDRARALAEAGADPWTTVVADEQTRGRGRRGTAWISSPHAGLWMSVVLGTPREGRPTPLEVGLACAEAMESVSPGVTVAIKWPNDLVVEEGRGGGVLRNLGEEQEGGVLRSTGGQQGSVLRKVGGILCEATGDTVVAGIGVNVAGAPDPQAVAASGGITPAALNDLAGRRVARHGLAAAVVRRLKERLGTDAPDTLDQLRRRDVLLRRVVETEQAGVGRADGIDASGALRLVTADGSTVHVVAGSVRLSSGEETRR